MRVGNGAWNQRQIDVYGELLGAAQRLVQQLGELDPITRQFLIDVADTAASRWKEQDQGIWEIRGEPRDFLYSKLQCWVALDRAIAIAPQLGRTAQGGRVGGRRKRSATPSWNAAGATRRRLHPGLRREDLDASNLMMAIVGFLPADDPRMQATIDATAARLTDERAWSTGTSLTTAWPARRERSCSAHSGSRRRRRLPGELDQARATFARAVAASTTWACWPRRLTRPPAS